MRAAPRVCFGDGPARPANPSESPLAIVGAVDLCCDIRWLGYDFARAYTGVTMVTGVRLNGLAARVRAGHFEIDSGVSEAQGGGDEGPDPHEILQAALIACTIITVQMYANRKGWALRSTDVRVQITSEDKTATVIEREIEFDGDLDAEQRARLLEIADKCPIHRLLEGSVKIHTHAAKG